MQFLEDGVQTVMPLKKYINFKLCQVSNLYEIKDLINTGLWCQRRKLDLWFYIQINILHFTSTVKHHKTNRKACPCNEYPLKKVQVGKDQEKAQSEKDSHSKNRGGKKPN